MNIIKKMIYCWRYGQLSIELLRVLRVGYLLLVILSIMLFWNGSSFSWENLILIDVLLGLPLVIVLWLTLGIIWQGLIKSLACVLGRMTLPIDILENNDNG